MGYTSKSGKRPDEYASKASHGYIIKDLKIKEFLNNCHIPSDSGKIDFKKHGLINLEDISENPIKTVIAIDGGFTEVPVKKEFPSAKFTFFQFGALIFSVSDLENLSSKVFIDPEDIARLKEIQRFKITLPTKNIIFKDETDLINSVRRAIYDEIVTISENRFDFISTLKWFVFQEYCNPLSQWTLSNCPSCTESGIDLLKSNMKSDYTFECPYCNEKIYLTDVFRLHEAIDNELGAAGILSYFTTLFEQLIIAHLIRIILKTKPALLNEILFIKDGPLAFFGQTANMHKPMRNLVNYLFKEHNLYLAGLEKSGAFVEHADAISDKLSSNQILLLDNDYIYKYIVPGQADPTKPYGRTTYYGNKLIFKSHENRIYVVTIPTIECIPSPQKADLKNLDVTLTNIKKLKCDMYDSSLLPISLVNKLVSLADHPSSIILEKFAKKSIGI